MTNEEYVNRFNESDMPKMAEIWNFFVENHELYLPNNEIDDIESLLKRATVDGVSREDFLLKEEYILTKMAISMYFVKNYSMVMLDTDIYYIIKLFDKHRKKPSNEKIFKARGKYNIEVNFCNDHVAYLNFWDNISGRDVSVHVSKGVITWTDIVNDDINKEISLLDFLYRISEQESE